MGAGSDTLSNLRKRRLARLAKPLANVLPTVEVARNFGEAVTTKAIKSTREIGHRAEGLAVTSRSSLSHQLVSARDLALKGQAALQATSANAAILVSRAYVRGKHAAADRRVQQVVVTLATLAVTAAIRRHPAGALVSSAWSMMETIGQSDIFRREKPTGPPWQAALAGIAGRHTWKRIGQTGRLARFTYVDVDGVVTERMVRNWRSTGRLIRGHCLLRDEFRCFRVDRIEGWSEPR